MIIPAKSLRNKNTLVFIPNDRPGWYRWFADKDALLALLDSPFLSQKYYDTLFHKMRGGEGDLKGFWYIYTGVAAKGSIRSRLNWHINQKHTANNITHGALSTFRQTISSLIAGDQNAEDAANTFIDKLLIEYFPVDCKIKSYDAKIFMQNNEEEELRNYVIPLNIMGNKRAEVLSFVKDLKAARKDARLRASPRASPRAFPRAFPQAK